MSGRINRRQALAGLGAVSLGALLPACRDDDPEVADRPKPKPDATLGELFEDAPSCSLTPEQTEGPFYFYADSIRSDIRAGKDGTALRLALRVRNSACRPLPDAVVDIWHCDALGEYSTDDEPFLRGAQVTNPDGIVEFRTVYPGWYTGRTPHIHAKVHVDKETVLTTQLYFDDDFNARVYRRKPYSSRPGRDSSNAADGIFDERALLALSAEDSGFLGVMSLDLEAA